MDNTKRKYDLDALRGVMMLLGIVLHSAASFVNFNTGDFWPYKFPQTSIIFDGVLGIIHLFRIPVFLILSGFFMTAQFKKYSTQKIISIKMKRIVFPFIFGLIFLAPLITFCFYLLIVKPDVLLWHDIIAYIKYVGVNTVHFWFLYYMIIYYLIHFIIDKIIVNYNVDFTFLNKVSILNKLIMIGGIQLLVLYFLGYENSNGYYTLFPPIGSIIFYGSYYLFGIFIFSQFDDFIKLSEMTVLKISCFIISFVCFLLLASAKTSFDDSSRFPFLEAFSMVLSAGFLVLINFNIFRKYFSTPHPIMTTLAKASYTIYIFHLPILIWLIYFTRSFFTNPFLYYPFLVITVSLLSAIVYIIKVKIEKLFGVKIL